MRGIARRLDDEAREIEIFRQAPARRDLAQNGSDFVLELSVKVHCLPI
jgi:hypothetical protein